MHTIRLSELAFARSGDKGNRANIGVVARDPLRYQWLIASLTEEVVAEYFQPMGIGKVCRYLLPGISALNFVIDDALAGGASRSLRIDTQGKTLATAILELRLPAPEEFR